jgi:hypothetical protein
MNATETEIIRFLEEKKKNYHNPFYGMWCVDYWNKDKLEEYFEDESLLQRT